MAIDIKNIIVEGLLVLCETYKLKSITIKQILEETKVSRQTFYNHFIDKNDLIHYVYKSKIIPDFDIENVDINLNESLLIAYENMKKYHNFLKQACKIEGQNCLKDYIFEHCKEFDLTYYQKLYGTKEMPETLKFAIIYHATASTSMTLSWILSDMPVSCEEIVNMIIKMKSMGMETLFKDSEFNYNPYKIS